MDTHNNKISVPALTRLRLRLDLIFLAVILCSAVVITAFPVESALFPPAFLALLLAAAFTVHFYALKVGAETLRRSAETFVLASTLVMWALVWHNGELASILLPAFVAVAGIFGLERLRFLILYSLGSVVLLLAMITVQDQVDFAVVGRAVVTLAVVISLLFYLRAYITLLDESNRERAQLEQTLKGVLKAVKISVYDERVSDGLGYFIHTRGEREVVFIGAPKRFELVEPEFREQLSTNLEQLNTPTEFRSKFDPQAESEYAPRVYRWFRQQTLFEYRDDEGELHRVGFSQLIEDEVKNRKKLAELFEVKQLQSSQLQAAMSDLSRKQQYLENEMAKFDSLCNQLDLIYWRLSLSDWTLTYNSQFAKRWGLEVGGSIDFETLKAGMHPQLIDLHTAAIDKAMSKKEPYRQRYKALDGPSGGHWFELNYWPELDAAGGVVAVNVSNLNISATVQIEDKLRSSNAEIARQQQREKAMYAVIGHELRTPAAILKMQLEQERKGLGTVDRGLFEASVDQLLNVVDTLRTVSKPDEIVEHEYSSELVRELVSNQVSLLQTLAQDAGMKLVADYHSLFDKPVRLMAGPLKQLISNLIKNAILHSGGSEIRVIAMSELRSSGLKVLCILVDDNGRGVAESERERLFEAYERGEGASNGTGLGLYICREIAKMMRGDLRYEPSPMGGARFVLEWSAEVGTETNDENSKSDLDRPNSLANLSVLLVEDDEGILQMTAVLLSEECAVLRIAKNGQQALDILAKSQVDLVLTDIFMPEMNGIEFTKAARAQGYGQPIIGLTAATLGQETESLLSAGADAVMNKPVRIDELKNRVATLLATDANSDPFRCRQ